MNEPPITGDEKLMQWFGLSYASFLVLPRVLMFEMPDEWKKQMAELLNQYDDAFDWERLEDFQGIGTRVQITNNGKLAKTPTWLINYRRPDREFLSLLKNKEIFNEQQSEETENRIRETQSQTPARNQTADRDCKGHRH